MSLLELFCDVDDFCQGYEALSDGRQLPSGSGRRGRKPTLALSEVLTIVIHFHQSHYRDFKAYYTQHVQAHLRAEFPALVSYSRFVDLLPTTVEPLLAYLNSRFGAMQGIAFLDSTPLAVCHPKRIPRHKVFAGIAARGKSSMGWFFGFKLHLVVNDQGELLRVHLTPGNTDDRVPVPLMTQGLAGKLFADKGYISQPLFELLFERGLQLITPLRRNMTNRLIPWLDKLLLRKRALIETINDQLKNICQIEHTRHRSPTNFVVNLLAALIAYSHQPKKPALSLPDLPARPGLILI